MAARLLAAAGALLAGCGAESPSWNLVLVTLDTTRSDYVSPYGPSPLQVDAEITPHLARLAERSWVFANAFSETNITNPSHLSIFTGLRARDHGVLTNDVRVPRRIDTLPEALRRAGYRTAGFPSVEHLGPGLGWRGFDVMPGVPAIVDAPEIGRLAKLWLEREAGGPFFLWAHFYDPHALYEPPPELAETFYRGDPRAGDGPPLGDAPYFADLGDRGQSIRDWVEGVRDVEYGRAMYAAEVHYADRVVGELVGELERLGIADRTAVVVLADHGESLDEHGIYYNHKGLYEPQLRIPLLIHAPGLGAGTSDEFVTTLDVAPTLEELFSLDLGEGRGRPGPGRSLVPLMRGDDEAFRDRGVFVHQSAHNHAVAVRDGPWKLVWPINRRHHLFAGPPELYDLAEDPHETVNLAEQHPERVEELREHAAPWIQMRARRASVHLDEAARERLRQLGYE